MSCFGCGDHGAMTLTNLGSSPVMQEDDQSLAAEPIAMLGTPRMTRSLAA